MKYRKFFHVMDFFIAITLFIRQIFINYIFVPGTVPNAESIAMNKIFCFHEAYLYLVQRI